MRIVVHGQQAFGRSVMEKLLANDEDIVAVCVAPDKEGRPIDPLKELAIEHNLPVHQPVSWKTDQALELMQSFDADVCMMVYVLLFVPETVRDAPKLGSFQYHPSLLPMHRGPSSINWPIAQGATETGLTIFWPDDGLDEGPILMQKTCKIGPDETLGDIYFKKLFPMGVDAMLESLELVKQGSAPKIVQNLDDGSYESWFGKNQTELDWSKPAQDIYNIIRAANPQPGAWTMRHDKELKIYNARLSNLSGTPGQVLSVDDDSFTVAAAQGSIKIMRVRAGAEKVTAGEYIESTNLAVGDKLG